MIMSTWQREGEPKAFRLVELAVGKRCQPRRNSTDMHEGACEVIEKAGSE